MATSEIQTKLDARTALTITLNSLASLAGRQSTLVANAAQRPGAMVAVTLKSGAIAPSAGGTYDVYLLRNDGAIADDSAGGADALLAVENAEKLGSIVVTADAGKIYNRIFDTWQYGPLGVSWGIAVVNRTDQPLAAAGNSAAFTAYVPEAQ